MTIGIEFTLLIAHEFDLSFNPLESLFPPHRVPS